MPDILLPATYYLDHYQYLLQFVDKLYQPLLSLNEKHFIKQYSQLSVQAKCLYVRLVNRQTLYYKIKNIHYPEINDIHLAIQELAQQGFIEFIDNLSKVEITRFLNIFKKSDLLKYFKLDSLSAKTILVQHLITSISMSELITPLIADDAIIAPLFRDEDRLLKFLFFGNIEPNMAEFVIRDLGKIKLVEFTPEQCVPRYKTRKQIDDCQLISTAYAYFKGSKLSAIELYEWFIQWCNQHNHLDDMAKPTFDKLTLRLGQLLEKSRLLESALQVYKLTDKSPSLERQIRICKKLTKHSEAEKLHTYLQRKAQTAQDIYFAEDFANKAISIKLAKATTRYLKNANIIILDNTYRKQPEKGVIQYLLNGGQQARFAENYLWRGLFGLLFWEVIFDEKANAIHQPFQRAPTDLYQPCFLNNRREALMMKIELLNDSTTCLSYLQAIHDKYYGTTNPIFGWHPELFSLITECHKRLSAQQLGDILLEIAADWRNNSCGFPDIFTCKDAEYCFIEVKSPNDHLSAQQLKWLNFFNKLGVNTKIIRIQWSEVTL
jgi:hypothetical protein